MHFLHVFEFTIFWKLNIITLKSSLVCGESCDRQQCAINAIIQQISQFFFSQFVELVDSDQCNIIFIGTTTNITIIIVYQITNHNLIPHQL